MDLGTLRRKEIIAPLRNGTVPRRGLEHLAVGLDKHAGFGAIQGTAVDRVSVDELDRAREGLAPDHGGKKKTQVMDSAAGFEGNDAQAAFVQCGSGRKNAESAPKRANTNSQQLRHLFHTGSSTAIAGKSSVKQRKGICRPNLECFKKIECISIPSLQFRVHARHEESVCSDTRGHSEISPAFGAVRFAKGDAPDRYLLPLRIDQSLNSFDRIAAEPEILRECVSGSEGHHSERDICSHQSLHYFVHGAVASTRKHRVMSLSHGRYRQRFAAARGVCFQ